MTLGENNLTPSDSELLRAIKNGASEEMAELYRRYDSELLEVVTGYLKKKNCSSVSDHAEKVKSDAWFNVLTYGHEDVDDVKAWLAIVGINAANNHLRKDCIRERNDLTELEERQLLPKSESYDYYATENAALNVEQILNLADKISPELSLILTLHYLEGYTFEEIAVRLGRPAATVRTIAVRGLLRIRKIFKRRGG
jgi:RNA polymerase sigma-70 factor (ECF subfamily)